MLGEIATVASSASKEASGVVKLVLDLINIGEHVSDAKAKRQIRKVIRALRTIYFEPKGILNDLRAAREIKDFEKFRDAIGDIKAKYSRNTDQVSDALKTLESLKAEQNLDIDLDVFQFVWKVYIGKGKAGRRIGSVFEYAFRDADKYGNFPEEIAALLDAICAEIEKLNGDIEEIDKRLRSAKSLT